MGVILCWGGAPGRLIAQASAAASGRSTVLSYLIYAALSVLAVAVLLFIGLIVFRIAGSSRERRLLAKREQLNALLYDVLTEDRSVPDVVATLKSVVPRRHRKAFELVMLENIRFMKGREREALTGAFEQMGYADEDIADLRKAGMVRRAEAAFHLGTMRTERAVPALIQTLQGASRQEVVFSCLNALSKIGTRKALEAVVFYLASSSDVETLRVAEVILERKQELAPYLEQYLVRGKLDKERTVLLIDLVGATKDARAVRLLIPYLENREPAVRAAAAFSLGNIGDPTACDALFDAMEDDRAQVRAEAAEAVGRLQCERAVPALRQGLGDRDLSVRMSCAEALANLGDEGRGVLQEALLSVEESMREVAAGAVESHGVRRKGEGEAR